MKIRSRDENLDIPNTRWDNFDPDLLPQDNLMGNWQLQILAKSNNYV